MSKEQLIIPLREKSLTKNCRGCRIGYMSGIATILMILMALAAGCGEAAPTPTQPGPGPTPLTLRLEPTLAGREFDSPTNFVQAGDGRVFVTEQAGLVWVFDQASLSADPALNPPPSKGEGWGGGEFLDIRDRVSRRGSEEGLLGMALAPDFSRSGDFYVYYSAANPRRSVVSRLTAPVGSDSADAGSELVIMEVAQPYSNHNGGQIAFGPDGYLYIALGDGGAAGDPQGHGQDTSTLLGAILRIDVAQATAERPYAIPPDNPFAGGGGRGEIWAYGLRNPWRFSFDRDNGELWAGDVGQNRYEEVDRIAAGGNYGWNVLEASYCFAPSDGCQREGMIPPVWEYPLKDGACSVIGGYVYRGSGIPGLSGVYVFGDFCNGQVSGLRPGGADTVPQLLADTGLRITSFGQDNGGELYLLSHQDGIYRLAVDGNTP